VQEDALRAFAAREGGQIVRLWRIAETATKAERRTSFRELVAYAKKQADRIDGLLVYKVDRAARNMTDYGRLWSWSRSTASH
jgi:DNA invertase Pin-like site-specific DNA recombinase